MISAEKLVKNKKSRSPDVDTVKISCENNKIIGNETMKSSEETSMNDEDFVHVIKSILTEYNKPVVVKIHSSSTIQVKKELLALNKLEDFQNSVKLICDFSCMDDKTRWEKPVLKPVKFCNNKTDSLHFIVLEYIENIQYESFFNRKLSIEELCSIFIQIELAIITLALDYRISHSDLNSGNILFSQTDKNIVKYHILGEEYSIKSFGIIPKFIDYGRCHNYIGRGKINTEYIIDDVFFAFGMLRMYINDETIKDKILKWYSNYKYTKDLPKLIYDTKMFFRNI